MIEGGWKVVGAEKLGLKLETSSDGSKFTKFTSAKLMDYKFAGILVSELLTPLKDKMLRELEALTFSKIKQNWFPLFLTNFILLHTYGLLINQQRNFAKRRKSRVSTPLCVLNLSFHSPRERNANDNIRYATRKCSSFRTSLPGLTTCYITSTSSAATRILLLTSGTQQHRVET